MRVPKLKNLSKWLNTTEKWEEDDEEMEEEQEEEIDEMTVGNEADIPSGHNSLIYNDSKTFKGNYSFGIF